MMKIYKIKNSREKPTRVCVVLLIIPRVCMCCVLSTNATHIKKEKLFFHFLFYSTPGSVEASNPCKESYISNVRYSVHGDKR